MAAALYSGTLTVIGVFVNVMWNESGEDYFENIELALAIPEYKVMLDGGKRPSQNDVFALLTSPKSLTAVTVEGKYKTFCF